MVIASVMPLTVLAVLARVAIVPLLLRLIATVSPMPFIVAAIRAAVAVVTTRAARPWSTRSGGSRRLDVRLELRLDVLARVRRSSRDGLRTRRRGAIIELRLAFGRALGRDRGKRRARRQLRRHHRPRPTPRRRCAPPLALRVASGVGIRARARPRRVRVAGLARVRLGLASARAAAALRLAVPSPVVVLGVAPLVPASPPMLRGSLGSATATTTATARDALPLARRVAVVASVASAVARVVDRKSVV